MNSVDAILWETQIQHLISQGDQGFLLFQLGPFPSPDADEASRLVNVMRQMETWGSFGHHLALTQGGPADIHYVLDALRKKDYEDWFNRNEDRQYQYWWNKWFADLEAYVDEHGDADIRWLHTRYDRYCLGLWCVEQRRSYHAGKLNPENVKRLEALPGWSWGPKDCSAQNEHEA
ncbi:MAG: helicase associated domain-containing protein [Gemmatimonadota bacterium]|nr:helicase associated domain-containing protein [Gemmatimonadota bacterium]